MRRERLLHRQPAGPNLLYRRDDEVDRLCAMGVRILFFSGSLTSNLLVADLVSDVFYQVALIHDGRPGKEGYRTCSYKSQLVILDHGLYPTVPPAAIPTPRLRQILK